MKLVTTGMDRSEQFPSRTAGWSNVESWTAHYGQHIMDSTTYNFVPLVVPATNFACPLDRRSHVNIRTACWGYGCDGPSQAF